MADSHDQGGEVRTSDRAFGAPRPSQTEQLDYHVPHPDAHPERHEHSDVPIRPLAISLAAIALTLAFTFVFLYFLFGHYRRQQEALDLKRTNVPEAKPLIEGPRLQGVPGFGDNPPREDLKNLRESYEKELHTYGKSGEDGFARVPIDRAMDLAIERGMFKTASPTTAPTGGGGKSPPPQNSPRREGAR
jgi:hypothetical protein